MLGVVSIFHSALTRRRQFVFLMLVLLANVVFFTNYGAVDKHSMFLPTYLVWAVWIGQGCAFLLESLQDHRPAEPLRLLRIAGVAIAKVPWERALLALPVAALVINYSYADVGSDRVFKEDFSSYLSSLNDNALVLGWWGESSAMTYLQLVEQMRPDVQVIDRLFITPEDEAKLAESVMHERPIYTFGHLPVLTNPYDVVPHWYGYKIVRLHQAVP